MFGISLEEAKKITPKFKVPNELMTKIASYLTSNIAYKIMKKIPVEITYSNKKIYLYGEILPLIFLFCFIDIIIPVWAAIALISTGINIFPLVIFILIVANGTLITIVIIHLEDIIPFLNVRILITNDIIEIYIQNKLYFQDFWNKIEKIESIKFKFWMGYKLNFISNIKTKTLRLHLLTASNRCRNIINWLKKFANNLNIDFLELVEKQSREDEDEEYEEHKKIEIIRKSKAAK